MKCIIQHHKVNISISGFKQASGIPKRLLLLSLFSCLTLFAAAQSISPATVNSSGQSATFGNYRFEWSVGEGASTATSANGNIMVTAGVLQPFVSNQPITNNVRHWLPEEVKVYPVPTKDFIEINILHQLTGKSKLELYDAQGRKIMEKAFQYYGTGRIEKWDLSKLAAGEYFLSVIQLSPVTGRPVKTGAFKIQKIQ
jgi:hypothetical protein